MFAFYQPSWLCRSQALTKVTEAWYLVPVVCIQSHKHCKNQYIALAAAGKLFQLATLALIQASSPLFSFFFFPVQWISSASINCCLHDFSQS